MEMVTMPIALIMAGGKGERLWPLSTSSHPKQFTALLEKTFFQMTLNRVLPLVGEEGIYVVTQECFKPEVMMEAPYIPEKNIILEPEGKNTAPCIGLGALAVVQEKPEEVMMVLPSDHLIFEENLFRNVLLFGCELGKKNYLVTIGITPTEAHTGYGYIHYGDEEFWNKNLKACRVLEFTEKPDLERAQHYLTSNVHLWNSGMFIWKAQTILDEIALHLHDLYQGLCSIQKSWGTPDQEMVKSQVFQNLSPISIDYGVMEKSDKVLVIPSDLNWNDIGSWSALEAIFPEDSSHNISFKPHFSLQSQNNLIYSKKPVVTFGVEGLIIVETDSTILVMPKDHDQKIKDLIQALKKDDRFKHLT